MTTTASLNILLEKTSDWDKDERYMATNDLCTALSKDIKIDENMEQRICAAVLKQLDDQSNDVQSVAVKCLAIITKKVQQAQIGDVCKKLISLILEGKDALRDVYSIGLKTLIADVPDSMGALVSDRLTTKLLSGISRQDAEDIQRECLDNMADLLRRFGHLNASAHHEIMSAVVKQLQSERAVIRKRAAHCLGALVVVSSDALLNSLVQILLEGIEASPSATSQSTRTLIQTIGTISRTVGYRLGRHLERIVPLFLRFCGDPEDESQQTDAANELRESCFPGLESFVLRCPKEVAPFLPDILQVAVGFMKYDPNYCYDSENEAEGSDNDEMNVDRDNEGSENEEEAGSDQDDYGEDEEQGGGSDDDDASWKVRKAAVKVILAVVQARPDLLNDTWTACGLQLVRRFKEREENVRLDIMHCFECLIQASSSNVSTNNAAGVVKKAGAAYSTTTTTSNISSATAKTGRTSLTALETTTSNGSNKVVQAVVAACCAHLSGSNTSPKTKSAVFALLRALVSVLNGGLDRFLSKLMPLLEKCLADKNQALKLDALVFLRCLLEHHAPSVLQPHLLKPLDAVVLIVQEDWYKVIAEALRVLIALVPVLRPIDAQSGFFVDNFAAFKPCVQKIYHAVWPRLEALDIDQEIKEGAIIAMGVLLSHAGDELSAQVPAVLAVYKKRLENETTRYSTLKAVATLSRSSIQLDLTSFFTTTSVELAMFLRQASRSLKQLTLQTLEAVVSAPATQINSTEVEAILPEAAALISDMDLHLSHLSLQLAIAMLEKAPSVAGPAVATHIYPKMLLLARSALMQGQAQLSLIRLFQGVVRANIATLSYDHVFAHLYSTSSSSSNGVSALTKQGLSNLSKCVAGIASSSPATTTQSLHRFTTDLSATAEEVQKQLALLCLGELGQQQDLSSIPNLQQMLLQSFESSQEDTKLAAAYALGHIAVGNTAQFLPILLQSSASSKHQYLLLVSLKELVGAFAQQQLDFAPYLPAVLPLLLQQCRSEEDSVRAMVAECLGVLTTMLPLQVLPVLLQLNADPADTLARRMIAHALRFSLSRSASSPAALVAITTEMHQFLPLLQDADLDVKKAALLMVNTAVHHNPSTVEHHLGGAILPALIETVQTKVERIVDLGPFKHRVDDYLPLRKIALTCLETLLEESPEKLDLASLVQVIPLVLADKDELKTQAHQILCKLSAHSPTLVAGIVEQLIAPLSKTLGKKPAAKDPAAAAAGGANVTTGPEADRALDLVKSAVRAVLAVNTIDDIANINRKWAEFADKVKKDEYTAELVRALENEKAFEGNY